MLNWQSQDENGDLIWSTRIRRNIREYLPGLIDISDEDGTYHGDVANLVKGMCENGVECTLIKQTIPILSSLMISSL
eukprot:scaffold66615_cov55-Attheya_sp.AAC.1